MTRKPVRPRHGTVVAYVALFVALGGTSYAAVTLSRNDVRSRHIKDGQVKKRDIGSNAVNSRRVEDGTLRSEDFKQGELAVGAAGLPGPTGPQGPKGDIGAKGDNGAKGDKGDRGPGFGDIAPPGALSLDLASCGETVARSVSVSLTEPSRLFASAMASFRRNGATDNGGQVYAALRNSSDVLVASTSPAAASPAADNDNDRVPLNSSSVMKVWAGDEAYVASAGDYALELWIDNWGICAGEADYTSFGLSYIVLGNG